MKLGTKLHPVLRALRKVTKEYREIRYLNHGGCCIVASVVAKNLVGKVDHVEVLILSERSEQSGSVNHLKSKMEDTTLVDNWNSNGIFFTHLIVKFFIENREYYFDGHKGAVKTLSDIGYRYANVHTGLEIDEAWALGHDDKNASRWNPVFDRKLIPKVHEIAEKHLKEIAVH